MGWLRVLDIPFDILASLLYRSTRHPHLTQRKVSSLSADVSLFTAVGEWATPRSLREGEKRGWASSPHSVIGCGLPAQRRVKVDSDHLPLTPSRHSKVEQNSL